MQIIFGRKELAELTAPSKVSEQSPEEPQVIYAIEAQAHYVIFHTRQGQRRELMRLYDAINRVSCAGTQVHRSWWVAHQAIETADFAARRLHLINGQSVPISRSHLSALRRIVEAEVAA
jgi:DNA-binding LytR/AlgR family response regulator